jgi:hypothetical protein
VTSSIQTLTRRIEALEARLADVEGQTLYELRRDTVGIKLTLGTVAQHLGLRVATEDDIDAMIDDES